MSGEKGIEVLYRGNWRKFVPAQDRRSYLFSWHTRLHRGYAHMLKAAEDMNITWPNIGRHQRVPGRLWLWYVQEQSSKI